MKQHVIVPIIVAVVFGAGGYIAGSALSASKSPTARFAGGASGAFAGGNLTGRAGGAGRTGNNAVFGTVISKDPNGITVQLGGGPNATSTNGTASGTRIVLINDSTEVTKMAQGSASDLAVGTGVTVTGTSNSDGSLTATMVQIRPSQGR